MPVVQQDKLHHLGANCVHRGQAAMGPEDHAIFTLIFLICSHLDAILLGRSPDCHLSNTESRHLNFSRRHQEAQNREGCYTLPAAAFSNHTEGLSLMAKLTPSTALN